MRKLHLNTEDLRVESFTTTDAELARRGTVRAQSRPLLSNEGVSICVCDTTHTQLGPECDPSAQTLCEGDTLCFCG